MDLLSRFIAIICFLFVLSLKLKKYSKKFPEDKKNILLENWDKFESLKPDTFIGMYNFWIRKREH